VTATRAAKRHQRQQSPTRSYDAFISYGQRTDLDIAVALQNGLRRLARPWHRRPALAVFRDETLSNSPNLKHELETALTNSRYLVLLASPAAAQSPWVCAEIEFFLAKPPDPPEVPQRDRILLAVTDGVALWDGDRRFTESSTAIPAPLQGVFDDVPKYTDLRPYRGRTDLSLDDPRFKSDVADIAAPIHGKHEGQLVLDADAKQLRIARVLRWTAVTALAVLTVAALTATVFAMGEQRKAIDQREIAEERRIFAEGETERAVAAEADAVRAANEARSRELAAQALSLTATDPELAALLAVDSLYPNGAVDELRSPSAVNAVGVTARALLTRSFVRTGGLADSTRQEVVATGEEFVATVGPGEGSCWPEFVDGVGVPGPVVWWRRATGERLDAPPPGVELPPFVNTAWGVLRLDSTVLATPIVGLDGCQGLPVSDGADGSGSGLVPNGEPAQAGSAPLVGPAAYDEESGLLFARDEPSGQFVTIEPASGEVVARVTTPEITAQWRDVAIIDGPAATGDRLAVVTTFDDRVLVVNLRVGGPLVQIEATGGDLASVGNRLFSGSSVVDVDLVSGAGLSSRFLSGVPTAVSDAQFSADGRFLALTDSTCLCRTDVWDLESDQPIRIGSISSATISSMRWAGDALALSTARGVEFFSYRPGPVVSVSLPLISADGSTLATSSFGIERMLVVTSLSDPGTEVRRLDLAGNDYVQALSGDGRLVALGGSALRVVDQETGEVVFTDADPSSSAAFDRSGAAMSVSRTLFDDAGQVISSSLQVYDTTTWEVVAAMPGSGVLEPLGIPEWISDVELAQPGPDGSVRLYRVVGDVVVGPDVVEGATRMWSSADRTLIVVADPTGFVEIRSGFDDAGELGAVLSSFEASTQGVTAAAISPDNERLVTASFGAITMWDISDPREPQPVEAIDALAFVDAVGGDTPWVGGVWFRDEGAALVMALNSSVLDLPDFDPVRVCAESTDEALDAAEEFLGETPACRRVAALQR
jgi:WD40 repeat protein